MRYFLIIILCLFLLTATSFAENVACVKSTDTYRDIKNAIERIGVISSHSHLDPPPETAPDFFDLVLGGYAIWDIGRLGNTFQHDKRYRDKSLPTAARWQSFEPIYDRIKNTGYMQSVRIGIRKLHGVEIKDADSIEKLNQSLKVLYSRDDLYSYALHDIGKIDLVLLNDTPDGHDPKFFREIRFINNLIDYTEPQNLYDLERQYGVKVHRLEDFKVLYDRFFEKAKQDGVAGFKCSLAYSRTLDYSSYDIARAQNQLKTLLTFQKSANRRGQALTLENSTDLGNYCMNVILQILEREKMPIAFHTGHQGGNHDIRHAEPAQLIPLIKEYSGVNFDLFHGGFPYVEEFTEMGKSYRNVYLNLCWSHILYPAGVRVQLSDMLECVPVYKIFAFGDDICQPYPELVIGHLEMARENVAVVLADKVLAGYFTEAEAIEFAKKIFRNNLIEFYRLDIPLE